MNAPLAAHTACVWEVLARKVGNVRPGCGFNDLSYLDFIHSAGALVKALTKGDGIGETILHAVQLRREVTPSNTNLGIILLLVPLAKSESREQLEALLSSLTIGDARFAFEAIRLASAGGLGDVPEQSVSDEPTVTLLEAMRLAADRDMIAKQYANGFADVYDFGVSKLLEGFGKYESVEAAIIHCQLHWLAEFPDSLIVRKNGTEIARDVQVRIRKILASGGIDTAHSRDELIQFDRMSGSGIPAARHVRNNLNPGTTADLVTACLFIALRDGKLKPNDPFPWLVTDWL